jgi:hypothetical protein
LESRTYQYLCGNKYIIKILGGIRYHLLSKVGYLKKTYGREELEPQPLLNVALMGKDSNAHDAKIIITPLQAQEMYLKIGGHRSFCQCIGNCSNSKTCKCKKFDKIFTSRCHGEKTELIMWIMCCAGMRKTKIMLLR